MKLFAITFFALSLLGGIAAATPCVRALRADIGPCNNCRNVPVAMVQK